MRDVSKFIEHTNLKPTITATDVEKLVMEAKKHGFVGVCVPPFWVKKASQEIGTEDIQVVAVIGFPFGYNMTETKIAEIRQAILDGADELDIVMNISAFKEKMPWVKVEIAKCCKFIHDQQRLVKVIIETAFLDEEEIREACKICADAGVDYVKTSTGFAASGATVDHVALLRQFLPSNVGIKASGGIRNRAQAYALLQAGADRLGTSAGVQIVKE